MLETPEYIINKVPKEYVLNIDYEGKILILNDKTTSGYLWDTKVKYWIFNLENMGYKIIYK